MYDAFDVGAFQYLVKPVDEQKFAEVFGRAAGQIVSEAELAGQFYRFHRGYLINLFHVEGYDKTEVRMANGDKLLLSILNFVGSMIAGVVNGLLNVRIDTGFFILFDEKPDLLWKIPMIAVLIFAGEAALIYFWQRYRILLGERQKHFVEEQQVKAMRERLEDTENFYGSIRKVRHEMKNHMANIKGLTESGVYGEIEEYVRRMDETMQELEYKYVTGNAVTDVIINDKCRRAEKAGIRFDADFRYGGEISVIV